MKIVIWDADNTLWEGEIVYGNVKLRAEIKEVLKQIGKLGIIQAICSKNDIVPLKKTLEELELDKFFSEVHANWQPKHITINKILETHQINPLEALFIDDDVVNRAEVEYLVGCHVDYFGDLYKIFKYLDTPRLVLMSEQRNRETAEKNWKGEYKDFINSINMEVTFCKATEENIPRIVNLANRTNELNATRHRYSEQEIRDRFTNEEYNIYVVFMKDRFGDYGLIAETIIHVFPEHWEIEDICVSCRTMGRGIGGELLALIKQQAKEYKIPKVVGFIIPNEDNHRMPKLFNGAGFKKVESLASDPKNTERYEWLNE